jgi:hypothetical protein
MGGISMALGAIAFSLPFLTILTGLIFTLGTGTETASRKWESLGDTIRATTQSFTDYVSEKFGGLKVTFNDTFDTLSTVIETADWNKAMDVALKGMHMLWREFSQDILEILLDLRKNIPKLFKEMQDEGGGLLLYLMPDEIKKSALDWEQARVVRLKAKLLIEDDPLIAAEYKDQQKILALRAEIAQTEQRIRMMESTDIAVQRSTFEDYVKNRADLIAKEKENFKDYLESVNAEAEILRGRQMMQEQIDEYIRMGEAMALKETPPIPAPLDDMKKGLKDVPDILKGIQAGSKEAAKIWHEIENRNQKTMLDLAAAGVAALEDIRDRPAGMISELGVA